jgi:hypothetical protein
MLVRRDRRGAEVVEFSLILPVLCLLVFGAVDYGWLFFQQSLVTQAVMDGMRVGAMTLPTEDEQINGGCAACISGVANATSEALDEVGLRMAGGNFRPRITAISGICVLQMDIDVPFEPIVGFIQVAERYSINISVPAQGITQCG